VLGPVLGQQRQVRQQAGCWLQLHRPDAMLALSGNR
jgi:hypothetical protein